MFRNPADYLTNPVLPPDLYSPDRKRFIRWTYDITTPESAEEGDVAEAGFYQPGGYHIPVEEARTMTDEELGTAVESVEDAIEAIWGQLGYVEPSGSPGFYQGMWYTQADADQDYRTGAEERVSAHLKGFTPREEYEVWQGLMRKMRK
jgi:hypothetical protein